MPFHKTNLKKLQLKSLSIIILIFSAILIILLLTLYLNKEGIITLPEFLTTRLWSLSVIISTFFVISLFLRLTIKKVFNFFEEPEEKIFYSKIYGWLLYSFGIFIILHQLGMSIGNITLFIGLLTTGLAFAIRDVLMSFFGWMILLRKKPFRIGDYIRIGDAEGKVMHIGTFFVLLDNTPELLEDYIRVPNRLFLEKNIINLGKTHYHEKLILQISSIPERKVMENSQKNILKFLGDSSHAKINLNIQGDNPTLNVSYLVSFDQKSSVKNEIIFLLNENLKEFLFFPK